MSSKSFHTILSFGVALGLFVSSSYHVNAVTGHSPDTTSVEVNDLAAVIGTLYNQPVDPTGKLLLSSWRDPDGSDNDQYIWDNFTLQSSETITEIDWFGVYDPLRFGAGGPVLDFSVSIFPSIAAGTEPAVANPPLVHYQTGDNAGEAAIGTASGGTLYAYAFALPTPFVASAGTKYWVQIEAFQHGSIPDWCFAAGSSGNGSHYRRVSGAGGDIRYESAPGDAAFTLMGPDTNAPNVVSSLRANPNPTSASSVDFTVTFSESVTGVDLVVPFSDFELNTTGVTGASITAVDGSEASYTVTVNAGSGDGTIQLLVVDDDTIMDAALNPLGGAGAANGNFTSGETYTIQKHKPDTTGVFRPSNGLLYLKNRNTTGFADIAINYGLGGDYPVVGDWDGNGTVTIGIYRGNTFYLRNENTIGFATIVFDFGQAGDQPIAGDWDGDGLDTIGIYRPSTGQFLLRNSNSAGVAQMSFYLGNVGDVGIAGDWDGDGLDTTGVFRPSNGVIFLKNTNSTGFADKALNYGIPGDRPVTGDWDADGVDTIGVYRNGLFYLRNANTVGFADVVFGLGIPGDIPIAGDWDGLP